MWHRDPLSPTMKGLAPGWLIAPDLIGMDDSAKLSGSDHDRLRPRA